jgi:hypothetical protein
VNVREEWMLTPGENKSIAGTVCMRFCTPFI